MKINKFKNVLKDFTDGIGLTFDPENEEEIEEEIEAIDSLSPQHKNGINMGNDELVSPFLGTMSKSESKINQISKETPNEYQPIFVNPKSFGECRKIADFIKNDKLVTLNLENVKPKDAQRILDFLSGAISIKEAKWIPISKNVFTSVPKNINFLYDGKKDIKQNIFLEIEHE